jgi:cell division protein FtsB
MDMTQIQGAIALVTTAIGMTSQAASTAELIKKLFSSDHVPDDGEASKLLNALATELTTANVMNMQLSEALKTLSRELQREDEFEKEKARYELFATSKGDMVYKLREDMAEGQPTHFVCPVCLNGSKQFMFIRGAGDIRHCQANNSHYFHFSQTPRPDVVRRRGPGRV